MIDHFLNLKFLPGLNRFKAADANNDGKLDKIEYMDFLHPEESNTMRSIVIDETIEDLDKNGDKLIGKA